LLYSLKNNPHHNDIIIEGSVYGKETNELKDKEKEMIKNMNWPEDFNKMIDLKKVSEI